MNINFHRFLDLASNHIGDDGGTMVAGMIHRNTTLRHLELKNNELRDTAAMHIGRYFFLFCTLGLMH